MPPAASKAPAAKRAASKKPAARKPPPGSKSLNVTKPAAKKAAAAKAPDAAHNARAYAAGAPRRASPLVGKHPDLKPQPAPGRPRHLKMDDIAAGVRLMKLGR